MKERQISDQSRIEANRRAAERVGKGNGLLPTLARRILSGLYVRDARKLSERPVLTASGRNIDELVDANQALKRR